MHKPGCGKTIHQYKNQKKLLNYPQKSDQNILGNVVVLIPQSGSSQKFFIATILIEKYLMQLIHGLNVPTIFPQPLLE